MSRDILIFYIGLWAVGQRCDTPGSAHGVFIAGNKIREQRSFRRPDQIIVLKDGRLEGCGKLKELFKNCAELKHIRHSGAVQ